uniref:G-protein coupled receptors family 1 profile domain-containing protein n=1 Tax=Romanomermis culicivorax TaxID=13658 RepID=A0A915HZP1_ROMCU
MNQMNDLINSTINSTSKNEINVTLVGTSYIVISMVYIVAYVLCLFIMCTDKWMSTVPLYRIIIHMGYSDLLQLVFNGLPAGVYSILGDDRPFYLNKILGAIVDAAWFLYIFLSQVLAINRFVHVFAAHRVSAIFSEKNTNIYITCCWVKQIAVTLSRSREKDKKLLLQAFLLCFSDVVTVVAYMTLQHVPSIGSIFPILINYTWILCAGNNVIVYVALNE